MRYTTIGKLESIFTQVAFDLLLISLIYFGCYYIKTAGLIISREYLSLYILVLSYWIILSTYHNKYVHYRANNRSSYARSTLWVAGYSLFFISLTLSFTGILSISRLFVAGTLSLILCMELLIGINLTQNRIHKSDQEATTTKIRDYRELSSLKYILPSAVGLLLIFFSMVWLKTTQIYYYYGFEKILLVLYGSWALSTLVTYRYSRKVQRNIYYFISPYLKSGIIMMLFVSIFYYYLRLEPLSRFLLFGTAIIHSLLEVVFFLFVYLIKYANDSQEVIRTSWNIAEADERLIVADKRVCSVSGNQSSWDTIIKIAPEEGKKLWQLFPDAFNHQEFQKDDISILSTQSLFNIDVLEENSRFILINLEQINNLRRINKYLLRTHLKLRTGGWIVGKYIALEDDRARFRSKMPKYLFSILYPFYFVTHRVLPKIPYLKPLYFMITKGRMRIISRAEVLGRLSYCGFRVSRENKLGSYSYFIAEKTHQPSKDQSPSYGPITYLERIGYHGERINIYKFRTMHPYSEFIQKEVFENNDLNESGKLRDDFRITPWGKIFRKLWIDEIPQLINWIRGDVSLIGTRALSEHYFSLYPQSLQELRTDFKPGLIPPFYADLPSSFDQILESEKKYLMQKKTHPVRTDIRYFWKAWFNIVIKGARSS
jgi:lipopolysaccharide/colanic/teichoic acid biosynthesis glycosyltransferase